MIKIQSQAYLQRYLQNYFQLHLQNYPTYQRSKFQSDLKRQQLDKLCLSLHSQLMFVEY